MAYRIDAGVWSSVFAVPTAVVDDHIKMCSPLSLKILLILLRHPGEAFDAARLSGMLNLSPADISDAVGYWVGAGIVSDGAVMDAGGRDAPAPAPAPEAQAPRPAVRVERSPAGQKIVTLSARSKISREDVNELASGDPSLGQLLREAQSVVGAPLTPVESEILTALHSYYGLPTDAVLMLLQYCVSSGHRSMSYLEKTAAAWIEKGITTHEQVEREILRLTQNNENEKKVLRAFGVYNRGLTTRERELVEKWFSLGLDEQLIGLACERTVENTGKVSFAYADKILTSWKARGIASVREAVDDMNQPGKRPAPQNRSARTGSYSSIDADELDRLVKSQFSD